MNWKERRTNEWDSFDGPTKGYFVIMGLCLSVLIMMAASVACSWATFSAQWKIYETIRKVSAIVEIIQAVIAWFN